jgi:lipoprotein-releasing system permease protein
MNNLIAAIALKHLLARRRQSFVSMFGIVLGVGFFLSVSALMRGSESDFIKRLVDNSPHITVQDEFRRPHAQPAETDFPGGAVEVRSVKPETETRGIRGYERILGVLAALPGVRASPVLTGQAIVNIAGTDVGITLNGMIPQQLRDVTTIADHMTVGSVDDLAANASGIVIGDALARKLSITLGQNLTLSANREVHVFKVVGVFHTGRGSYDEEQAFVNLKRAQALFDRPFRANTIIIKLADPYQARTIADEVERSFGYKSVSWQEASEDLMTTLAIRNIIMYSVVSAVLVVAAFGIYNVISTVVLEKHRDIAILKSIGFYARDIQRVFVIEGFLLGVAGSVLGLGLGALMMLGLQTIRLKYPGSSDPVPLPIDWNWSQFTLAAAFAMVAALTAAFLPARKGARVNPAEILRGS